MWKFIIAKLLNVDNYCTSIADTLIFDTKEGPEGGCLITILLFYSIMSLS